jgi:hypothetical protein
VPKILFGFALIHWFWQEVDFPSIILKSAVGVPLGLGISSSLFFIAVLLGFTPKTYSKIEFWMFLCAATLTLLRFASKQKGPWKFFILSSQDFASATILLAGAGLLIYAFLLYSRMHPYGFEDAWSIWNYPARFIYRTNSADIIFNNQFYELFHPDYPLGLGLNVAWGWLTWGRESTSVPIAIGFYIVICPALILWGALQKWRGTLPALLGTLLYMMSPNLEWSVGQMADGLLALYFLSALVMLYGYLRTSHLKLLLLAGLLAGFSAWIKNEGMLFICVFLFIFMIMAWKRIVNWSAMKWLSLGIFLPLLVVATYKSTVHSFSELFSSNYSLAMQVSDVQRWWTIGREFLIYIVQYGHWPVSIVLVLFVYIILTGFDASERRPQIWLLAILLAQFAGYFGIYLISPYDLDWHLFTSVDRVVSHLFPMVFFWLFVALQPPQLSS